MGKNCPPPSPSFAAAGQHLQYFLPQIKSGHTGQKSHYSTPLEATCLFSAAYMKSHISLLPPGVLIDTNISDNLFLMSLKGAKCQKTLQSLNDAKMLSADIHYPAMKTD